jgi:hypothetical protein
LFGSAFRACSCGFRHSVDADHVAAIDAIARKPERGAAVVRLIRKFYDGLIVTTNSALATRFAELEVTTSDGQDSDDNPDRISWSRQDDAA